MINGKTTIIHETMLNPLRHKKLRNQDHIIMKNPLIMRDMILKVLTKLISRAITEMTKYIIAGVQRSESFIL